MFIPISAQKSEICNWTVRQKKSGRNTLRIYEINDYATS